jgi:hypothetical protein
MPTATNVIPFVLHDKEKVNKLKRVITHYPSMTFSAARVSEYLLSIYVIKGHAHPSLDKMAEWLGYSKRTIITAIQHLEALGFFKVKRPASPHRGTANEYIPQFSMLPSDGKIGRKPPDSGPGRVKSTSLGRVKSASTQIDSKETTKVVSLESLNQDRKGPHARAARPPSSSIPEGVLEILKDRDIWNWQTFYEQVLDDRSFKNDKVRNLFHPTWMDTPSFERSINRFVQIVVKQAEWKNLRDACQYLVNWFGIENRKCVGKNKGEYYNELDEGFPGYPSVLRESAARVLAEVRGLKDE